MESLAVTFLGIIALSSLVQAAFIVGLAIQGRRTARQVGELQERVEREIQPGLAHLTRIARNAAEVSDIAVVEARRVDVLVGDLTTRLESLSRLAQRLLIRPLRPVSEVAALLRGLRAGLDVYHRLKHFDGSPRHPKRSRRRRGGRRDDDEEHLFI